MKSHTAPCEGLTRDFLSLVPPLLLKTSSTVDTEIVVWRETLRGECFYNSGFLTVAEMTEQDETLQTSNTNILYLFAYIS